MLFAIYCATPFPLVEITCYLTGLQVYRISTITGCPGVSAHGMYEFGMNKAVSPSWRGRGRWGIADGENKVSSSKKPELSKVLSFMPRAGQNDSRARRALPTARDSAKSIYLPSSFNVGFFFLDPFSFFLPVPAGSSLRGGDVVVYVFDINQSSLPTPFYSVPVSISVMMAFQLYFIP